VCSARRKLLALAVLAALVLFLNRRAVVRLVRRFLRATSSGISASEQLTRALASAATDLRSYLSPPQPQPASLLPSTSPRTTSSSSSSNRRPSAVSRRGANTSGLLLPPSSLVTSSGVVSAGGGALAGGAGEDSEQVPRSIRRVLRIMATPECAAVLRNLAAGAAQGAVREATRDLDVDESEEQELKSLSAAVPSRTIKRRGNSSSNNNNNSGRSGSANGRSPLSQLFAALQTPGGEKLAVALVRSAVHEAVSVTLESSAVVSARSGSSASSSSSFETAVRAVGGSESGLRVVRELVRSAVEAATPLLLAQAAHSRDISRNSSTSGAATASGHREQPSSSSSLPHFVERNPALVRDIAAVIAREAVCAYLSSSSRSKTLSCVPSKESHSAQTDRGVGANSSASSWALVWDAISSRSASLTQRFFV